MRNLALILLALLSFAFFAAVAWAIKDSCTEAERGLLIVSMPVLMPGSLGIAALILEAVWRERR